METNTSGTDLPDDYYTYFGPAGTGTAVTTSSTPDGSATAIEFTVANVGFAGLARLISGITAGNNYTFSADAAVTSAAGSANIYVSWRDGSNNEISNDFSGSVNAGDGYMNLSITAMAPVNAVGVQIAINFVDATITADNFCIIDEGALVETVAGCDGSLITNGTLNANKNSWFTYPDNNLSVYGATSGAGGTGGVVLGPTTGNYGFGQNGMPITAGETYLARVEAKVDGGSSSELLLKFQDAGGASVGASYSIPVTSAQFQLYEIPGTAPANAATAEVLIVGNDGATITIDNVCLLGGYTFLAEPACDPAENLTTDYGFENATEWFDDAEWTCRANNCSGSNIRNVADAASGTTAVRIEGQSLADPPSNGYNAFSIPFDAVAGGTYNLTVALKRLGNNGFSQAHIYWNVGGDEIVIGSAEIPLNGGWADYSAAAVAPAGATSGELVFEMGDAGFFLVDNVCLIEDLAAPVTLAAFMGEAGAKSNRIYWATATEENTAMFYLERSATGTNDWQEVTTINAAGNSETMREYTAEDENPFNSSYYRLRSVDFDGSEQLSEVLLLERKAGADLRAFPNPFGAELSFNTELQVATDFRLVDILGRTVKAGRIAAGAQQTSLSTATLPKGRYVLRVGDRSVALVK